MTVYEENCRPEVDLSKRVVRYNDKELRLSKSVFNLIAVLAARPGHVMTRSDLTDRVFGYSHDTYPKAIDSTVKRGRRAMVEAFGRQWIKTDCGTGYFWDPDPRAQ